jgi:primosomal protein N' (replication factor Y)
MTYTRFMYHYFVWVRSNRYHGQDPLTYSSSKQLSVGTIVQVELQKEVVLGVIIAITTKPRFQTKAILKTFELEPLPVHLIKTAAWLQSYYPSSIGVLSQQLLPAQLNDNLLTTEEVTSFEPPEMSQLPPLTPDQTRALAEMQDRNSYILHGATGSGKTRVYIELVAESIRNGKSAIVLTPEISLITQLATSFQDVFKNRVIVLHSQQTPKERQQAWLLCLRSQEPVVMIGPRSALFSPVRNLGIIILDESHESAYKQEQSPQYQTGRVAAYMASIARTTLILGSATPSISDYYIAEQKNKPIIRLSELAHQTPQKKSTISIVDRKDLSLFSRSPYLSNSLIDAIQNAVSKNEQTLLYLNRRGTARLVMCENCGWQAVCPHCDLPLTYHGDQHLLRCHSCDYHEKSPASCPICNHPSILFKTAGTKAIVDEVKRLFPDAKIARFDTDNLKADRFERHYDSVKAGDVDIIIGTQLLAKGLDLPKLSTLGILLADTSLYLPDYSAEERTFQLVSQVLGRVGRGHVAGVAIIQTYHPSHPILLDAINGNYKEFYNRELIERKRFMFPPYCYLLKITVRRARLSSAESAAQDIKNTIELSGASVRVEGPAPAFYERFQNKYQWQLVIKSKDRKQLLNIIQQLPQNCSYDIDPNDLL